VLGFFVAFLLFRAAARLPLRLHFCERHMTRNRRMKDSLSTFRASVDADDGADPRDFFKKESSTTQSGRKSAQLCAQVTDTLTQILGGECADDVLQTLQLIEVSPAPDSTQFLVLVAPVSAEAVLDSQIVLDALHRASGWLRAEIAAAITRKRAPGLVFRYLPGPVSGEVQP
jgi:ribosome-binding factor A